MLWKRNLLNFETKKMCLKSYFSGCLSLNRYRNKAQIYFYNTNNLSLRFDPFSRFFRNLKMNFNPQTFDPTFAINSLVVLLPLQAVVCDPQLFIRSLKYSMVDIIL